MNHTLKSGEVDSAVAAIRKLRAPVVEAKSQIVDCLKKRDFEKEMLASLPARSKTKANKECLKAAAKPCRLGIKPRNLSITAFEKGMNAYPFEIGEIPERIPQARMDQ